MSTLCHTLKASKYKGCERKRDMEEQLLINISKQLERLIDMHTELPRKQQSKIGRPSKEHVVTKFRESYPNFTKAQCVEVTGLTIKTVSKYWNA